MKNKSFYIFPAFFATVLVLCLPSPALAVPTITATPSGDGVILVRGLGLESAAALDILVKYDSTGLANPRVNKGPLVAGAMTAIGTNVPGTVRMAIVRLAPVTGSGVIASMDFDRTGSAPGKVLSLEARLSNVDGAPIPAMVRVDNPSETPTADALHPQVAAATQESGATGAQDMVLPAAPLAVSLAGEKSGVTVDKPEDQEAEESLPPETESAGNENSTTLAYATAGKSKEQASPPPAHVPTVYTSKGVLDRFEEYRGARTAKALVSLFSQENYIGFRQEPKVAFSDGMSPVKVTFISTPGEKTSSDVEVSGARLVSLRKDPDNTNTWIALLMPEKDAYRASIAVHQGDVLMVFPLTIAPRITAETSGTITEADLNRYLNDRRKGTPAGPDHRNEKTHDFIDDYIFTANYLAAAGSTSSGAQH